MKWGSSLFTPEEIYLLARYFAKKVRLKNHIIYKEIISHHNPDVRFKSIEIPSFQRFLCIPGMEEFMESSRLTGNLDDNSPSAPKGIGELIIPKISFRKKEGLSQVLVKIMFLGRLAEYRNCIQVYTDGSKTESKCSCAVVIPFKSLSLSYRLPPNLKILSAELMTIKFSLQAISSQTEIKRQKYIVCTDSLSALDYSLKPATLSYKCLHCDLKFRYTICNKGYISSIYMGSSTLWYKKKRISKLGYKTSLPTGPDLSNSYYWYWISVFNQFKNFWKNEARLHSSHSQFLDLYDYKQPSKEMYLKSCIFSACLFRLRSGHAKTKSALFLWKMAPFHNCDTCGVYEDIRHIIFNSSKYEKDREILINRCEKIFKAFTMRCVLGHHTSFPWARRSSTNLWDLTLWKGVIFDYH